MSWYIPAAVIAALVLPPAMAWHWRRSKARLAWAEEIWVNVEQSARVLLEDRQLDPRVGDFIEFVIDELGNGTLTRTALRSMFVRPPVREPELYSSLEGGREVQFSRFMLSSILYDSLQTTLSGIILRRWMYWLSMTVRDKRAVVTEPQVAPVVDAADKMWHSSHHQELCAA